MIADRTANRMRLQESFRDSIKFNSARIVLSVGNRPCRPIILTKDCPHESLVRQRSKLRQNLLVVHHLAFDSRKQFLSLAPNLKSPALPLLGCVFHNPRLINTAYRVPTKITQLQITLGNDKTPVITPCLATQVHTSHTFNNSKYRPRPYPFFSFYMLPLLINAFNLIQQFALYQLTAQGIHRLLVD